MLVLDESVFYHVCIVKAVIFPVVIYRCESWTIKQGECWTIDAFELWLWRRLLKVPWTARRSNQSILKEINPEYLWEELMLKLKLQYFGHLMQRANSLQPHGLQHARPGLPLHRQLPEFIQTHAHWVCDAIQASHPPSFPSPPVFNLSQHQSLFQWVKSSHEVAQVLELQL